LAFVDSPSRWTAAQSIKHSRLEPRARKEDDGDEPYSVETVREGAKKAGRKGLGHGKATYPEGDIT